MNRESNNSSLSVVGRFLTAIAATACCLALSTGAQAALQGSAGNTQIWNKVTVNYNAGSTPLIATSNVAVVTVNTVNVTPTILSITPSPGSTDGTGATQQYTFTVMTNSNGPGVITLGAADNTPTNLTLSGTTPVITGSVFLGATVFDPTATQNGVATTVAAAASITVAVPNDHSIPLATATTGGAFNDGVINGLAVNSVVYISNGIGGTFGPFTVTAVSDPAEGSGTTATPGSITLRNNTAAAIGPFTPAVGWQIVEAKILASALTVTQGVVTAPASAASWVTTVTATMGSSTTANVTTTAHSSSLTVTKYVRNATAAVVGTTATTAPAGIGGATYYQTGVSGKPGDILEYLLIIANSGTGSATAVIATDPVPVYTVLRTAATYSYTPSGAGTALMTDIFAQAWNGTTLQTFIPNGSGIATVGYGKSAALIAGSAMTYYLGSGSTTSSGGAIATGGTTYVVYQVTIN